MADVVDSESRLAVNSLKEQIDDKDLDPKQTKGTSEHSTNTGTERKRVSFVPHEARKKTGKTPWGVCQHCGDMARLYDCKFGKY